MSQLNKLVLDAIRAQLETRLKTQIPTNDLVRVDEVKLGRLLPDNPVKGNNVHLLVCSGDPDDPNYLDGPVSLSDHANVAFEVYPREIGGGEYWWRRGVVQMGVWLVSQRLEEAAAMEQAYILYGRVLSALSDLRVGTLCDDFNEQALHLFIAGATMYETGGPKATIWRGKVRWQVLTARS